MNPAPNTLRSALAACLVLGCAPLFAGNKNVAPPAPEPDKWEVLISVPAWLATVEGTTGLHGKNSSLALGVGEIIPRIDMAAALRAEVRKGNFGVYADILYLSLSDGIGTKGIVKKIDFQEDEYLGDLGFAWRILKGPRGYLDVIAGVHYTNVYEALNLQANDERVEQVSNRLAKAGTLARGALLARELNRLDGHDQKVPSAPLAVDQKGKLLAAIRKVRGNTQARAERISDALHHSLDHNYTLAEDWVDPYIGLRGLYNFNDKFYLTGRGDIGGFGIGADLAWSASLGVGYHLSETKRLEVAYRALGSDYEHDGFVSDLVYHGPEISLVCIF